MSQSSINECKFEEKYFKLLFKIATMYKYHEQELGKIQDIVSEIDEKIFESDWKIHREIGSHLGSFKTLEFLIEDMKGDMLQTTIQ